MKKWLKCWVLFAWLFIIIYQNRKYSTTRLTAIIDLKANRNEFNAD